MMHKEATIDIRCIIYILRSYFYDAILGMVPGGLYNINIQRNKTK